MSESFSYEEIYSKVREVIEKEQGEKLKRSVFFSSDAEDHIDSLTDFTVKLILETSKYNTTTDKEKFLEDSINSVKNYYSAYGPKSGIWISEFVEEVFYENADQGSFVINAEAQKLLDDRWPLTYVSAILFKSFQDQDEHTNFVDFVESRKEFILNDEQAPHIDEDKYYSLIGYYEEEDFAACYLFAAGYAESEFSRIRNSKKVQFFRKIASEEYSKVSGDWRDPVLSGFVQSVQKHWGSVSFPTNLFPEMSDYPTRHSLAHGIPTKREISRTDALQMLLILQAVPFWLEHLNEAYEELDFVLDSHN